VKILSEAIRHLAKATGKSGDCIAQDESLNCIVGRGLKEIAEAIQLIRPSA